MIPLNFSIQEINAIIEALSEATYKVADPLIRSIVDQVNAYNVKQAEKTAKAD